MANSISKKLYFIEVKGKRHEYATLEATLEAASDIFRTTGVVVDIVVDEAQVIMKEKHTNRERREQMAKPVTCECGECKTCTTREYNRAYRAKKRRSESEVKYPITQVLYICADDTETPNELFAYRHQLEFYMQAGKVPVHPVASTVYQCSDKTIYTDETVALRHELHLFRMGTSHG